MSAVVERRYFAQKVSYVSFRLRQPEDGPTASRHNLPTSFREANVRFGSNADIHFEMLRT